MGLRVLLADESPSIKKVFDLSLQDFGIELETVTTGAEAAALAEKFQPDIVFADILLPQKSGYEVCTELKTGDATQRVPVVLMWSSFMELDAQKFQTCGANGSLEKPFEVESLRDLIKKLVPKTQNNPLSQFVQMPSSLSDLSKNTGPAATPQTPLASPQAAPVPPQPQPAPQSPTFQTPDLSAVAPPQAASVPPQPQPEPQSPTFQAPDLSPVAPPETENSAPERETTFAPEQLQEIRTYPTGQDGQSPAAPPPEGLSNPSASEPASADAPEGLRVFPNNQDFETSEEEPTSTGTADPPEDFSFGEPDDDKWAHQDLNQINVGLAEKVDIDQVNSEAAQVVVDKTLMDDEPEDIVFGNQDAADSVPEMVQETVEGSLADTEAPTGSPPLEPAPSPVQPSVHLAPVATASPSVPPPEQVEEILRQQCAEIVENVVWKVVPELASTLIKKEIQRLLSEKDLNP